MHNFYDYTQSTGFYNETWYLKGLLSLILCAMLLDLRMQISVQKTSFMIPFDLSTAVIYQKIREALVRII